MKQPTMKSDLILVLSILLVAAIAIMTCAWMYYNSLESHIPYERKYVQEYSPPHKANTPKKFHFDKHCSESKNKESCTKQAAKDFNEYVKDKRDLIAQEGMWRAATKLLKLTALQLWVFALSTIASLVAIWLIYDTLRQTKEANINAKAAVKEAQEANDIARQSAEDINRAWCYVKMGAEAFFDGENFDVKFCTINAGNTPAKTVNTEMFLAPRSHIIPGKPDKRIEEAISEGAKYADAEVGEVLTILPAKEIPDATGLVPDAPANIEKIRERGMSIASFETKKVPHSHICLFALCVITTYTTTFSDKKRKSYVFYGIKMKENAGVRRFFAREMTQYRVLN